MLLNPFTIRKWVKPFYLRILHANYAKGRVRGAELTQFHADVEKALRKITPRIASKLIADHWRGSITGSWFAGLKGFTECREQIGEKLLASRTCFAGQSHAFAMACFADDPSADYLERYLDRYLRKLDCYYDQGWAMPALVWIDEQRSTSRAERFLKPGGLWDQFTAERKELNPHDWRIGERESAFWLGMHYCQQHFLAD